MLLWMIQLALVQLLRSLFISCSILFIINNITQRQYYYSMILDFWSLSLWLFKIQMSNTVICYNSHLVKMKLKRIKWKKIFITMMLHVDIVGRCIPWLLNKCIIQWWIRRCILWRWNDLMIGDHRRLLHQVRRCWWMDWFQWSLNKWRKWWRNRWIRSSWKRRRWSWLLIDWKWCWWSGWSLSVDDIVNHEKESPRKEWKDKPWKVRCSCIEEIDEKEEELNACIDRGVNTKEVAWMIMKRPMNGRRDSCCTKNNESSSKITLKKWIQNRKWSDYLWS